MIPDLRKYSMTDVGTRLEHLADLQELWSFALGIETAGGFQSVPSVERSQKLEAALNLLEAHMMNDYKPTVYAYDINTLPKDAAQIVDKFVECTRCGRENTEETWKKHNGKCPNCQDLFGKD